MGYTTYWSILDTPSHSIQASAIALSIALIGATVWIAFKFLKKDKGDKTFVLWASGVISVIGILMYILLVFYPEDPKANVAKILESPQLGKVEGVISNFKRSSRRTKYGSETIESFYIDTIKFAYGDATLGKFNSFTKTNNTVIYNGQRARITFSHDSPYGEEFNTILKLELAK